MQTTATWAAAFLFALALDFAAARWTMALAERRYSACAWSVLCFVLGFGGYVICYDFRDAVCPSCAGHALGTWLAIRWSARGTP